MIYSNRKFAGKLKKVLLSLAAIILLAAILLTLYKIYIAAAIVGGFLLLELLVVGILNLQYIRIFDEKGKLIIRYFSLFSLNRLFQSIEFPAANLRNVEVYKYLFGLKWDIRFTVRTKQGLADYPAISFSAIPFSHRKKLITELGKLHPGSQKKHKKSDQ